MYVFWIFFFKITNVGFFNVSLKLNGVDFLSENAGIPEG